MRKLFQPAPFTGRHTGAVSVRLGSPFHSSVSSWGALRARRAAPSLRGQAVKRPLESRFWQSQKPWES